MSVGFAALFTFIGFPSSVTPFMYFKWTGRNGCFLIFLAFMKSVSRVSDHTCWKDWEITRCYLTCLILKKIFSGFIYLKIPGTEGFTTYIMFIRFLSIVISFMFSSALQTTFAWILSTWLVSSVTSDVPVMRLLCEGFPAHALFTWFSSKRFLVQIEIWNKAEVVSTFITLFPITDSLYHMTSGKQQEACYSWFI